MVQQWPRSVGEPQMQAVGRVSRSAQRQPDFARRGPPAGRALSSAVSQRQDQKSQRLGVQGWLGARCSPDCGVSRSRALGVRCTRREEDGKPTATVVVLSHTTYVNRINQPSETAWRFAGVWCERVAGRPARMRHPKRLACLPCQVASDWAATSSYLWPEM
jgi:hypothetical protein